MVPLPADTRMMVAIAFHFNAARLPYLAQVLQGLDSFPCPVQVSVLTNTGELDEIRLLQQTCGGHRLFDPQIARVNHIPHPFMLPWAHKAVLKEAYERDPSLTHFVYLEDDMALTPANMAYWVEARQLLAGTPFYPSLLRVERHDQSGHWVSTDLLAPAEIDKCPQYSVQGYDFINLPNPYQGLTIYDRALMAEHIQSPSFDYAQYGNQARLEAIQRGEGGYFDTRERATHGQTYVGVPRGYFSRNLLGFSKRFGETDIRAWIHHLPNNYVNNPETNIGKVPVKGMLVC